MAFTACAVFVLVLLPFSGVYCAIFGLGVDRWLLMWSSTSIVVLPTFTAAILWFGREPLALLDRWGRHDKRDPEKVQYAAMGGVREITPRVVLWFGVPAGIVSTLVVSHVWGRSDAASMLALGTAVVGLELTQSIIAVVSFDLLLRPLREEVSEALTGDPAPARGYSIRNRIMAGTAATGWGVGLMTTAIAVQFDSPAARLGWGAVAATLLAIVLVVAVIGPTLVTPILRPMDDLRAGTRRLADGVYDQSLALTTDDEFGDLVRGFNQMQAGLYERERLRAAFGSYVDPALAQRLLDQGDDLFAGEEAEVTVLFADVRDFTPFAERVSPQDALERLNALFGLVVPILREHHGHANKFLGDGVLAVFGVPEPVEHHADHALAAAQEIQCRVLREFGEGLRLGVGINTGRVIAGTVGGGGKLEFTLIGDAVNVAARVEERTKTTGDAILLTQSTFDALQRKPDRIIERGDHELKGKSATTCLYAVPFE